MATGAPTAAPLFASSAETLAYPRMPAGIWHAPLVWAALATTAGIVADRLTGVPLGLSIALAVSALLAWLCCSAGKRRGLPLVYLALAGVAFGAFYHHYRRDIIGRDDVSLLATNESRLIQLRGFLDEEPTLRTTSAPEGLEVGPPQEAITAGLCVRQLCQGQDWVPASGRLRISGPGPWADLHCGDEVEVEGRLLALPAPANPGEPDWGGILRDQGFTARVIVRLTPATVRLRTRGWSSSWRGWLAVLRAWGADVFRSTLPKETSGLATALLLGDTSALPSRRWAHYQRTGVIHVLAISGQHLVVLGGFLWLVLPRLRVRQRPGAWLVALALLGYALLSGGRPPVMRSAATVCAACGALSLRRLVLPANVFALAWLVVALLNPMDLFTAGCQLSFLSVAVLYWGVRHLLERSRDPLEEAIEASRPAWQRSLRWLGAQVRDAYLLTLLVWLAVTPLAAASFHVIPLAGLWLGPPVVLLSNLALFLGFGLLLVAVLAPPLTPLLAWPLQACLQACDGLVRFGEGTPFSFVSVGDIPAWWLGGFYLGLLAVLTQPPLRRRWGWGLATGLGWLSLGLLAAAAPSPRHELRCTFLAVGHGGCTVLELPDGRTLLYDAGSMAGPDVTRRVIAPYLWHRGIRHLDEVFLSHADLDHFNGVVDLLDYFSIGQVSCTPTFAQKPLPGVAVTLDKLRRRGTPVRTIKAGDSLLAGDVALEVLHPPAVGPEGNENARSLVLEVRHAGHVLLLTGDLEGPGLERLLQLPPRRIGVLMAPHHGSPRSNIPRLAEWASPALVVASQGPPPRAALRSHPYSPGRTKVLGTWPDGAITIHSRPDGLAVETFTTRKQFVLPSSPVE
jgi:competence protein ComEC